MPAEAQFPFSQIVGQARLKTALLLCAIDPKIGGILLSGMRGTAKSTIARSLAALMPKLPAGPAPFVDLPLGATEERVCGSLNLEQIVAKGQMVFSPGLVHAAHGGILYIDEVNLLPDHLVDLLLDVTASGINHVERDGISHRHPAEFLLIGTMNPTEGELRPQLLDRYGLYVEVCDDYTLEERVAIAQKFIHYAQAPDEFLQQSATEQAQLIELCQSARTRLPAVTLAPDIAEKIAECCMAAGVQGMRGDLTMHRAARAHAALAGRTAVTQADVDAIAEAALAHRRQPTAEASPPSTAPAPTPSQPSEQEESEGDWGSLPPVTIATGTPYLVDASQPRQNDFLKKKP